MDYFNEIIQLSKRLLRYESVYGHGGRSDQAVVGKTILDCQKEMLEYCRANGFHTYMDPEGMYSYAETGQGNDYIALLTHLDVVKSGDLSQWDTNPFQPEIIGEKLVARGAADDKVPAAIAVVSVIKLLKEGYDLKYPIRIIFGGDEETGFRCIHKYKENHSQPKYTLVMDGTFPFSYSEKHLLNYELHTGSSLDLWGGAGYNSVIDHVIWKYNGQIIEETGKSAHASRPELGENALVKLSCLHSGEDILFDVVNTLLKPAGRHNLDFIDDEGVKFDTTFNIGKVGKGVLYADIRVPPEMEIKGFMKDLEDYFKRKGIKARAFDILPGTVTDTNSPFAKTVLKCYQEKSGDYDSKPFKSGSATYGRSFASNCLSFGPRMSYHITNTHKPNEFITFDLIENAFEIYTHTLRTIEEEL